LIGCLFETASQTASSAVSSAPGSSAVTDAQFVDLIRGVFPASVAGQPAAAVPPADVVDYAKGCFARIGTPAARWEALQVVLSAVNGSDASAQVFYNAMTPAEQDQFKREIWVANGRRDNGQGTDFGNNFVAVAANLRQNAGTADLNANLSLAALTALRTPPAASASSSAASSSGTAASSAP
jgi:hypothetical protein